MSLVDEESDRPAANVLAVMLQQSHERCLVEVFHDEKRPQRPQLVSLVAVVLEEVA